MAQELGLPGLKSCGVVPVDLAGKAEILAWDCLELLGQGPAALLGSFLEGFEKGHQHVPDPGNVSFEQRVDGLHQSRHLPLGVRAHVGRQLWLHRDLEARGEKTASLGLDCFLAVNCCQSLADSKRPQP